jgi:hypothetical protein
MVGHRCSGRRLLVQVGITCGLLGSGLTTPSPGNATAAAMPHGQAWSHATTFANGPSSPPLAVTDTANRWTIVASSLASASTGEYHTYVVAYGSAGSLKWHRTLKSVGRPTAIDVAPETHQITVLTSDSSSIQLVALTGTGHLAWVRPLPAIYRPSDPEFQLATAGAGRGGRIYVLGTTDSSPTELYAVSRTGHILWHRAYNTSQNGCSGQGVAGDPRTETVAVSVFCGGRAQLLDFGAHGHLRWRRSLPDESSPRVLQALAVDPATGDIALSETVANDELTTGHALTAEYTSSGHLRWTHTLTRDSARVPSKTTLINAQQMIVDAVDDDIIVADAASSANRRGTAECLQDITRAGKTKWTRCQRLFSVDGSSGLPSQNAVIGLDPTTRTTVLAFESTTGGAIAAFGAHGHRVWNSSYNGTPETVTVDPDNHHVSVAGTGIDNGLLVTQYSGLR